MFTNRDQEIIFKIEVAGEEVGEVVETLGEIIEKHYANPDEKLSESQTEEMLGEHAKQLQEEVQVSWSL